MWNVAALTRLYVTPSPQLHHLHCRGLAVLVCACTAIYILKKKKGIIKNLLCQDHGSQTREFSCSIAQLFHTVLNYKSVKVNA